MARTKRGRGGTNVHTYYTTNQKGYTLVDSYGQNAISKPQKFGQTKGFLGPKPRLAHVDRLPAPYARSKAAEQLYNTRQINYDRTQTYDPNGPSDRRIKVKRGDTMKAPPDARQIMKEAAAKSLATSGGMGAAGGSSAPVFGRSMTNQTIQFLAKMPENLKRVIPPEYRWTESELGKSTEGPGQGGGDKQAGSSEQQKPVQKPQATPTASSPSPPQQKQTPPVVVQHPRPVPTLVRGEGLGNNKNPVPEKFDNSPGNPVVSRAPQTVTSPISQGDIDAENKDPCAYCDEKSTWFGKKACYAGCKIKNVFTGQAVIDKLKNFGKWLLRQIFENLEGVLDTIQWLLRQVGIPIPGLNFLGSAIIEILKIAPKAVRLATWTWDNVKQKPNQSTSAWIAEVVYKTLLHVALLAVNIGLMFVIKESVAQAGQAAAYIPGVGLGAKKVVDTVGGAAGDLLFKKIVAILPKGWVPEAEWSHILYGGWINQAVGVANFIASMRNFMSTAFEMMGKPKAGFDTAYKAVVNLTEATVATVDKASLGAFNVAGKALNTVSAPIVEVIFANDTSDAWLDSGASTGASTPYYTAPGTPQNGSTPSIDDLLGGLKQAFAPLGA